jgi:hypothetical protein
VHAAHNITVKKGRPTSKYTNRRDNKKQRKIYSLQEVMSSPKHSLDKVFLSSRPVFYSGTTSRIHPNGIFNGRMLSAIEDLQLVNTVLGAYMKTETGDTVFILIPRQETIEKMTHVQKTLRALDALDKANNEAENRGKKRIPVAEGGGKYTTVGLKPNRGSTGITESWPHKLGEEHKNGIKKIMTRCYDVARGYLPPRELRGIQIARLLGEWHELKGVASRPIWGSLACGKNYYLNSHTDEDFFYSLTTIASERDLRQDIDRYRMDAEVSNYFTFPEQGIAVALRPGDMLIFNPLYHHCLSSRTSLYEAHDVFCLSLYLKTAVVGKNDNSLALTKTEIQFAT